MLVSSPQTGQHYPAAELLQRLAAAQLSRVTNKPSTWLAEIAGVQADTSVADPAKLFISLCDVAAQHGFAVWAADFVLEARRDLSWPAT
jgi:hypothetical protein